MKNLFSVAICPPASILKKIREMKELLAIKAGWFGSKNSDAHITLNIFEADENELLIWENYILLFCHNQVLGEIKFTHTDSFSNGAFYLAPSDNTKKYLEKLLSDFNKGEPLMAKVKSTNPHMSIGRRLNTVQLNIANSLWGKEEFDLRFTCEGLTIRKFNPIRKQYEIYKQFKFNEKINNLDKT